MKTINEITIDEVVKTYSGKSGCGCGCRGTYRVNPVHLAFANEKRGFDYSAEEINLATCKLRLNKLQQIALENPEAIQADAQWGGLVCYAFETESHNLWIYTKAS